jgi:[protein-PII] uridylyltransferase
MHSSPGPDLSRFAAEREALLARLRKKPDLTDWCELHTNIVDDLVREASHAVFAAHPGVPPVAVVATGGYGRRELAPYSDADLTVVPLDEAAPGVDILIKELYRALTHGINSVLKLEVGYSFRLVNDAPGLDEKSRTGLLDARLIAGSQEPLDALMDLYWTTFPVGEFVISKLEERALNCKRFNDTPLVVEPNLKEGAGGLRSFQAANWIRSAIGERPIRPSKPYADILHLRTLLHLVSQRRQDVLTRQRQAEVADLLGVDVYVLTADCAKQGLELQREFQLAGERLFEARFPLVDGVSAIRGEARIQSTASTSAAVSGIAQATQLGLQVPEEHAVTTGFVDGPEVLVAISAGEKAIRNIDKCGLLDSLLPELALCKTLMPHDSAHKFTVYEHTLRAIRVLDELPANTFLGDLKNSLRDLGTLYLAVMLHDVGKAQTDVPHSESGAVIAEEVCRRWQLSEDTVQVVSWLVKEHLTMARFVRIRDVYNPQTTQEFAPLVGDQDRLDMLTLLTYADINAVSDEAWTPAQESFLKELYARTSLTFQGDPVALPDASAYRRRLLREFRTEKVREGEVEAFLDSMPAHYLASTPPEVVRLHLRYVDQARTGEVITDFQHDGSLGTTELTVCTLDQPGLLSSILAVLYAFDLTIHGIRASTSELQPNVALDVFNVSFGGRPMPSATTHQLAQTLEAVLSGKRSAESVLLDRGKDPNRTQQHFTFTYLEGAPSILEVQTPKGRGMAYRLSRVIAKQGWNITAARVGQWAGRGAAAFYLLGKDHNPISRAEVDRALSVQV